jgi:predicted glutamine amidotransferase
MVVTDGSRAVITRYITGGGREASTLYYSQGKAYTCVDGVCRMLDEGAGTRAVLVASEPLSQDAIWTAVDPNHLVTVDFDNYIAVEAITLDQP